MNALLEPDPPRMRSDAPTEMSLFSGAPRMAVIVNEWRRLAERTDASSYFQTPDWVLSWWEDCGRPPTQIGSWWSTDGHLEAIALLSGSRERFHHRVPFSVAVEVNPGSGRPHSADHCGWPCLPHRARDVRAWLASRAEGRSLLLRHLDRQTGTPLVPDGARLVLTTACPRVLLAGDGPRETPSSHFRKHLGAWRRKLERLGVSFEWTPPEKMSVAALDVLFDLHKKRHSAGPGSTFLRGRSYEFHRRLIESSGAGRGPAMVLALCGGNPIGILYGFLWRDTFYDYQSGWDTAWARHSLGTVLVAESMRLAAMNGARWFDFMRGGEAYKYRFGAVDRIDETWLVPHGLTGRMIEGKYKILRAQRTGTSTSSRAAGNDAAGDGGAEPGQ